MKWSKMEKSKRDGGLGFPSLDSFNQALLAKQRRILTRPSSLMAKIIKEKCFKN